MLAQISGSSLTVTENFQKHGFDINFPCPDNLGFHS